MNTGSVTDSGVERFIYYRALIDILILETSFVELLYEKQPLLHDVYDYLYQRQFRYAWSFEQILDPSNGAVLQADALLFNAKTTKENMVFS